MRVLPRFLIVFSGTIVVSLWLHELGHAWAAWGQGIAAVPTPVKQYMWRSDIAWARYAAISAGGIIASMLIVLAALVWYARTNRPRRDAVLAGALVMPYAYSVRFLLAGRGHDGLEFQAAQWALGWDPVGHGVDLAFVTLGAIGTTVLVWRRWSAGERIPVARAVGLFVLGLLLVIVLQDLNNLLFDPLFQDTRISDVPSVLRSTNR